MRGEASSPPRRPAPYVSHEKEGSLRQPRERPASYNETDETGATGCGLYDVAVATACVSGRPVTVRSLLEQPATRAQRPVKADVADMSFAPRKQYGQRSKV